MVQSLEEYRATLFKLHKTEAQVMQRPCTYSICQPPLQ